VVAWATDILAGPADEADQNLIFQVSPADPTLFSALPQVDYQTGNLTYTPAENAFGQTTVEVVLRDSGGNANGGINVSPTVQFTLTITAVNDLPVVSDFSKTSMIDQPVTLTYNDFNAHFDDVESELVSVRIESLPENGVLSLNGVPVIQGLVILANDLDGLVYSPTLNWWGRTGFHWDGFDGEIFTGAPATVTLNVNPLAWPIFIPFVQVIY
jgi:hypothetical protein